MKLRFSAAALVLLKLASSESLRCVRCNRKGFFYAKVRLLSSKILKKSYIDVENSHCWNPTHDLLVTCPDRLGIFVYFLYY
jgi:hypothetical protein